MNSTPVTALMDLNNDDYAVIDKDTGTVLGTNLALVRWDAIPEETREDILTSDSAACAYATGHGRHLFRVDAPEMLGVCQRSDAWEAVVDHPLMRRAMASRTESTGLERVLAELDRLHALDQDK